MNILFISDVIPMVDRSGGYFRFHHLLKLLSQHHRVTLFPGNLAWQKEYYGADFVHRYRILVENLGVSIIEANEPSELKNFVRNARFEMILIEHFSVVPTVDLDYLRFWNPHATVIVDSVDVAFARLASKAALTNKDEDLKAARETKLVELQAYQSGDMTIAISELDRRLLKSELPHLEVEVVPLIYATGSSQKRTSSRGAELIFVGHFDHDANVDGIEYFCDAVFPLVLREIPEARLKIVGHAPPQRVRRLASSNIAVLGYVPDIAAEYASCDVAVAPMRFGGGLKGKIGEAMSHGIPVVTNSVCLRGFSLTPGQDVMAGDAPDEFAGAIVALLRDPALYEKVSAGGLTYVEANFSERAVAEALDRVLRRAQRVSRQKCPINKRLTWRSQLFKRRSRAFLDRHILWRFKPQDYR